jgi:hypothetical protein
MKWADPSEYLRMTGDKGAMEIEGIEPWYIYQA